MKKIMIMLIAFSFLFSAIQVAFACDASTAESVIIVDTEFKYEVFLIGYEIFEEGAANRCGILRVDNMQLRFFTGSINVIADFDQFISITHDR